MKPNHLLLIHFLLADLACIGLMAGLFYSTPSYTVPFPTPLPPCNCSITKSIQATYFFYETCCGLTCVNSTTDSFNAYTDLPAYKDCWWDGNTFSDSGTIPIDYPLINLFYDLLITVAFLTAALLIYLAVIYYFFLFTKFTVKFDMGPIGTVQRGVGLDFSIVAGMPAAYYSIVYISMSSYSYDPFFTIFLNFVGILVLAFAYSYGIRVFFLRLNNKVNIVELKEVGVFQRTV